MDNERLRNPPVPGASPVPDYFHEWLARIRDIRASERRMYLRVREIFTLAADYEPTNRPSERLFYLRAKARFGWTRKVLLNQIKADAYERSVVDGKSSTPSRHQP